MKRSILFALAVLILGACSTQEKDFQTPAQDDAEFYASFEQPAELGTKVYASEELYLRWNADDRITIFNQYTYNQEYRFNGETGDNSGSFKRVDNGDFVTGNSLDNIYAIYPYLESTRISDTGIITVDLPAEQKYAENTFGLATNTMISATTDNQLMFKNVGGYLMLKLYGDDVSVSSVTMKGNNGEYLSGKSTVTMPVDGNPSVKMLDSAGDEISLVCETPVKIGSTAETATSFWIVLPPTVFSKGFTLTVKDDKKGVFEKATSKSIEISRNNMVRMSSLRIEYAHSISTPEAVDLGLPSGLKWASFNLGASSPEEFGGYYAWGEIEPKDNYSWATYKWCNGDRNKLTKYCPANKADYWDGEGEPDGKTVLDPEDDAAQVYLGDKWCMPTVDAWMELEEKCTWTWTTHNGMKGYTVTGPNGNWIFLPTAGLWVGDIHSGIGTHGDYHSSSLQTDSPNCWSLSFNSGYIFSDVARDWGESIRPIYGATVFPVESVSLGKTEQELVVGYSSALVATVLPTYATDKSLSWSSNNPSVATVSSDGIVYGVEVGSAIITVTSSDGKKTATCNVIVKDVPAPEPVDLGLPSGLKWASFNLGASSPEEFGGYYAWGEIEPKDNYSWATYKWCNGDQNKLTKYCPADKADYWDGEGMPDGKTVLDPEDDAAQVYLGDKWRMPTVDAWKELKSKCTWTWTTHNGVKGYTVTGPNGNWIFLPGAGLWDNGHTGGVNGYYRSSSLFANEPDRPYSAFFNSNTISDNNVLYRRYYGASVRPVYAE